MSNIIGEEDKVEMLIRKLVANRMKRGMSQARAIKEVLQDLQDRGSSITKSQIYFAVTGKWA